MQSSCFFFKYFPEKYVFVCYVFGILGGEIFVDDTCASYVFISALRVSNDRYSVITYISDKTNMDFEPQWLCLDTISIATLLKETTPSSPWALRSDRQYLMGGMSP